MRYIIDGITRTACNRGTGSRGRVGTGMASLLGLDRGTRTDERAVRRHCERLRSEGQEEDDGNV